MAKRKQPQQQQQQKRPVSNRGPPTAITTTKGSSKRARAQAQQPAYFALLNQDDRKEEEEQQQQDVEAALQALEALTEEPEAFVASPPELAQALTRVLKAVFDHARSTQPIKLGPLQELLVEGFDTETLWEQLQLRNPAVSKFVQRVIRRLEEQGEALAVLEGGAGSGGSEEGEGESEEESEEEEEEGPSADEEAARFEQLVGDDGEEGSEESSEEEDSEEEEEVVEESEAGSGSESCEEENEEAQSKPKPKPTPAAAKAGRKQPQRSSQGQGEEDEDEDGEAAAASKLNDGFFDWNEMERFADEAEQEEFGDDDEDVEEDDDDDDEDMELEEEEGGAAAGARELRYKDFFGDNGDGGNMAEEAEEAEEEEEPFDHEEEEEGQGEASASEEEGKELTAYERMKRSKRKEIAALEEELVAERPWELRGEVKAADRPENSLLEAVVDVERARRPESLEAPAETSQSLEEMIKQRILEERFDDVVPRGAGEEVLLNRRGSGGELPDVSQEKSQVGLGEVYEKEYLRLALGVEGESAEAKAKAEMAALFRRLCTKLDALSNFHFTPKAVKVDLSVRANAPAIAMEEVLPLAVSAADTHAPEEVHEKKRGRAGVLRDPAELAQEDRRRLRQCKKAARRKARRHKAAEEKLVARLNPGLGNKYAREKMRAEIRESGKVVQGQREGGAARSTSSKFFSALQDEVTQHGGSYAKKKAGAEEDKKAQRAGGANALKL